MSRGAVLFASPKFIQNAVEYALKIGNDPKQMREKPGEVMGYLAHGHPFLDGNGRTIMVVHLSSRNAPASALTGRRQTRRPISQR